MDSQTFRDWLKRSNRKKPSVTSEYESEVESSNYDNFTSIMTKVVIDENKGKILFYFIT